MPTPIAVLGIYTSASQAERAVDHLLAAGFTHSAVSVLLPEREGAQVVAYQNTTKAPEGAATGVTAGGVVGGTLGLLAGLGALAIPGVGPPLAAGPLMAALAGLGVGNTVGGLVGTLVGLGIPEIEAKRYEGHIQNGGTLLSVHCTTPEQVEAAGDALNATGAQDISTADETAATIS